MMRRRSCAVSNHEATHLCASFATRLTPLLRMRKTRKERPMTVSDRIRIKNERVLSQNHYTLKPTTVEWRRANGEWQTLARETYDRGNGATLLPYNLAQRTVVLVRQFCFRAYVNGCDDLLIEALAGLLDNETPEARIRAEAEEETGYRLGEIRKVFEAFMSPGAVTDKVDFLR